ncbi:MAG: isoleucine--tRNA ligase [Candidatus Melainabacteria bacterium]|nr:isoleucine--tRNA ligase [Candidatus Melainabacteria bacterium]
MSASSKPGSPTTDTPSSSSGGDDQKQYKNSLNLPQTTFPMKAGAATREPELQAFWESARVYERTLENRNKQHAFVLHDGPPYLSSDKIHIGTALNKILKDIVTRYKATRGYYSPFVPGYDGHGLPIEGAVERSIEGGRKSISAYELRQRCRAFALGNLHGQETNFKRLGVWGNWSQPYLTIDGAFEAEQIRLFTKMYEKGHVYKGLKPVYWCPVSESALAEAEIEYADHESDSIYVKFAYNRFAPLGLVAAAPSPARQQEIDRLLQGSNLVIWTTTPWTLPSNVALAVHPQFMYALIRTQSGEALLVARDLLETFVKAVDLGPYQLLAEIKGQELEGIQTQHPFLERESQVLLGDHVTAEAGTGIVHTAPGHGPEDYALVTQYNRQMADPLPILSPVDGRGHFTAEVPDWIAGLFYKKANAIILEQLQGRNRLLHASKFVHSYPHSWRSHAPVIYRATEQWFVAMDGIRQPALDAIKNVHWVPARGEVRLANMVEGRTDWCISRQRVWGVPIPAFYCQDCGSVHISQASTERIATLFEAESSDAWEKYSAEDILDGTLSCQTCGSKRFRKEQDVMDVWFDSGVSHTTVVKARTEELGGLPADLYLEGSDQHRGWFQSSLLTSVMLSGTAPYKAVLTHGFVLDEKGRKMSKSLGNVVDPNSVTSQLGADVLRLWVASVDYTSDVRIGKTMLDQLAEVYKKIRNTARFLLGNLSNFNPETDRVPYESLSLLDRYILHSLQQVVAAITESFDAYEFHRFYQVLQNFCVVELSALYFDVVKDTLYCNAVNDPVRRGIQTVLHEVLHTLNRLIVPVMPHLAEDIWQHTPETLRIPFALKTGSTELHVPDSILLAPWPEVKPAYQSEQTASQMANMLKLKEAVNMALEEARSMGRIRSSLEVCVAIQALSAEVETLNAIDLAFLFISSQATVYPSLEGGNKPEGAFAQADVGNQYRVYVLPAHGTRCERCWKHQPEVGEYLDHPTLCARCHTAVSS